MMAETLRLRAAGAVCVIARTNTPAVETKLRNAGGLVISHENFEGVEKNRWLLPPDQFAAWCDKVTPGLSRRGVTIPVFPPSRLSSDLKNVAHIES